MSYFEHKCLNNIKKIYQHLGKCNDKQNLKYILNVDMMYTTEDVTDDSLILPMTYTTV